MELAGCGVTTYSGEIIFFYSYKNTNILVRNSPVELEYRSEIVSIVRQCDSVISISLPDLIMS